MDHPCLPFWVWHCSLVCDLVVVLIVEMLQRRRDQQHFIIVKPVLCQLFWPSYGVAFLWQFTFQHWSLHTSTISPFKALACEKNLGFILNSHLHYASSTHRFQGQQIASPSFWPPRLLQWDESGLPRSHVVTRIYSETGGKDPQNS